MSCSGIESRVLKNKILWGRREREEGRKRGRDREKRGGRGERERVYGIIKIDLHIKGCIVQKNSSCPIWNAVCLSSPNLTLKGQTFSAESLKCSPQWEVKRSRVGRHQRVTAGRTNTSSKEAKAVPSMLVFQLIALYQSYPLENATHFENGSYPLM